MILISQVMMKNIYTLEFQNTIQFLLLTKHYMKKLFLKEKKKTEYIKTQGPLPESNSTIVVQTNSHPVKHAAQFIPFYDPSFFKYKNNFQGIVLPDNYSLVPKTIQQQQCQDLVLRTVYSWLSRNEKPESLTPLISGTPYLHTYYKRFLQFFSTILQNFFVYIQQLHFLLKHTLFHSQI